MAQQASHDETFPILDCKQRLRGYTYVMGHDMDEVLMPAKHQSIKELLKEQLMVKDLIRGSAASSIVCRMSLN